MISSDEKDGEWVNRGFISASECFSCANKINHKRRAHSISVLCRDPCNYKPLRGERHPKLEDIEKID